MTLPQGRVRPLVLAEASDHSDREAGSRQV